MNVKKGTGKKSVLIVEKLVTNVHHALRNKREDLLLSHPLKDRQMIGHIVEIFVLSPPNLNHEQFLHRRLPENKLIVNKSLGVLNLWYVIKGLKLEDFFIFLRY